MDANEREYFGSNFEHKVAKSMDSDFEHGDHGGPYFAKIAKGRHRGKEAAEKPC